MTIDDIGQAKLLPARQLFPYLRERLAQWRTREHRVTQRMAGAAFVIRVASAAIMFISQVLLARWMGSSAFGSYVYVFTWLLLLGDLVHLGIPLTAQRYLPEYTQTGSLVLLRGYLSGARWLTFAAGTVAAIIGALIVHAFAAALDTDLILPFYFACAALPFYALTFMLDGLARLGPELWRGRGRLRDRSGLRDGIPAAVRHRQAPARLAHVHLGAAHVMVNAS
jgi:hypothetical protein